MGTILPQVAVILVMGGAVALVGRTLSGARMGTVRRKGGGGGFIARSLLAALPGIPLGVAYASIAVFVLDSQRDPTQSLGTAIVLLLLGGALAGMSDTLGSPVVATVAFGVALVAAHRDLAGLPDARWWFLAAMVAMFVGVGVWFAIPPARFGKGLVVAFAWADVLGHLFVTGRVTTLVTTTVGRWWLLAIVLWCSALIGVVFRVVLIMGAEDLAFTLLGIGMLALSSQRLWFSADDDPLTSWLITTVFAFLFAIPYGFVSRRPRIGLAG